MEEGRQWRLSNGIPADGAHKDVCPRPFGASSVNPFSSAYDPDAVQKPCESKDIGVVDLEGFVNAADGEAGEASQHEVSIITVCAWLSAV